MALIEGEILQKKISGAQTNKIKAYRGKKKAEKRVTDQSFNGLWDNIKPNIYIFKFLKERRVKDGQKKVFL